jgi:tetratricopeptide (TPR) repeat protein
MNHVCKGLMAAGLVGLVGGAAFAQGAPQMAAEKRDAKSEKRIDMRLDRDKQLKKHESDGLRPVAGSVSKAEGSAVGQAARALVAGHSAEALIGADAAIRAAPRSAWAHYHRATALSDLRRYDDAVASYERAGTFFPKEDDWGRSVALWGRARTLREAGRCDEAKSAFNEYIALVAARDQEGANQAYGQAAACKTALERGPETPAQRQATVPAAIDPPNGTPADKEALGAAAIEPPPALERAPERPITREQPAVAR